jgi:molecular chaperone GrpE
MNHKNMDEEKKECEKCQEYLDGWKRAQADYQNLKKETEKEKSEYVKFANEKLLHEFLPALDQFSLALGHIPKTDGLSESDKKIWDNWLQGIRAVRSLWDQVAADMGLEKIPTDGAFDPMMHDAVGEEVAEGKEPGKIIKVIHDGWKWHGKILRPAKVIIAK